MGRMGRRMHSSEWREREREREGMAEGEMEKKVTEAGRKKGFG